MRIRTISLFSLVFVGCSGSVQKEQTTVPLVEIARSDKPAPVEPEANDEETDIANMSAKDFELADKCLARMREGRGLPRETGSSEAGVLYTEALTHERAERLNDAKKGYLSVAQRFPQSPVVPLVYFAFGELFLEEGQSDPMKLAISEQSYREVLKYPPPSNTATAFTIFRLAHILEKEGKGQESLSMLYKFMTLADTQPNAECVRSLNDSVRKLMVNTYAEVGQPSQAFSFFVRSSGGRSSNKTNAFAMLADLCDIYVRQKKPNNAAEALVAVNEDHATREFCAREDVIFSRISSSISTSMRDEYLRMHAQRCE